MKFFLAVIYYLIYAFLFYISFLGIAAAAMNRDTSFIAQLGFFLFIGALILFPIFLAVTFKKITTRRILVIGGVPIFIYIPFFVHFVVTNKF